MKTTIEINIRDANNTYTATIGNIRASATSGPKNAANSVAEKFLVQRGVYLISAPVFFSRPAIGREIWSFEVGEAK